MCTKDLWPYTLTDDRRSYATDVKAKAALDNVTQMYTIWHPYTPVLPQKPPQHGLVLQRVRRTLSHVNTTTLFPCATKHLGQAHVRDISKSTDPQK